MSNAIKLIASAHPSGYGWNLLDELTGQIYWFARFYLEKEKLYLNVTCLCAENFGTAYSYPAESVDDFEKILCEHFSIIDLEFGKK